MSRKEAVEISNIVRHSENTPTLVRTGSAFKHTAEFEIKYYKIHDDDMLLKICFQTESKDVLHNVNVDFTPMVVSIF